jgi:hypothetical protein
MGDKYVVIDALTRLQRTELSIRLYCGFEDAIEEFDVSSPGEGTRLSTTPSKKTKEGLKGGVVYHFVLPF